MTKPSFFPLVKSCSFWRSWTGKAPETFCCTGGQEGAELSQALLKYGARCGNWGAPWNRMHVVFHPLTLGYPEMWPRQEWHELGCKEHFLYQKFLCYQQIISIPPKYQSWATACCWGNTNAILQSMGETSQHRLFLPWGEAWHRAWDHPRWSHKPGALGACLAQQNSGFKEAQKSINGTVYYMWAEK